MKNELKFSVLIVLIQSVFFFNSCKKDEQTPIDTAIKDGDGNTYSSVTIGTQVWLTENLKSTKYLNGDIIGTSTPVDLNLNGESTPKYQWAYEGNESNAVTYGRLYTWYAATDSRKVCPAGWHVPSDTEWTVLTTFLGGEAIAGGKLKEDGTAHWTTPNTGATNESGFKALPSGSRSGFGTFDGLGLYTDFWSITEKNPITVIVRGIGSTSSEITGVFPFNKYDGLPVRCLKD
ncbi:MAG: fibrobacter succinogenes major paralogous domain-containing protein [Bacteroidales bacterium]|nr:fibrobacter succinogenes major paralogous domain-containing protein [Bacteroidales bacterium]